MVLFTIPRRVRRALLAVLVTVLCLLLMLVAGTCVYAYTLNGRMYFQTATMPADVRAQFRLLSKVLDTAQPPELPDIYSGYSRLCGWSYEWALVFCGFYSMALAEQADAQPGFAPEAAARIHHCARIIMAIPEELPDADIPGYCAERTYGLAPILAGYRGLVLATRRKMMNDDLFDVALTQIVSRLATAITSCYESSASVWPADQALHLHAIALCDESMGTDHRWLNSYWQSNVLERFQDPATGFIHARVATGPDRVLIKPCATSAAWLALLLADVLPDFARQQYEALCRYREFHLGPFEATKEFGGFRLALGDVYSGPLLLGLSPAASGFTLCAHKLFGEEERFTRTWRVFEVFGMPRTDTRGKRYYLGNAMGDAVLLYAKVAQPRVVTDY